MSVGPAPAGPEGEGAPGETFIVRQADLRTSIRPTVAAIDLGALGRNAARVQQVVGDGVAVFAVVKADAYGHGAVEVGRALAPKVSALAVSLAEEGCELREAGLDGPILVLGAYYGNHHSEVLEAGLTPVVYDAGDLQRFAGAPVRRGRWRAPDTRIDVHLKIDTGMNRLGIAPVELDRVVQTLKRLPRLRVSGVCTHFSSAHVVDPETTGEQLRCFADALSALRAAGIEPDFVHAANSAAALRFPEARFSAVRPGLALYGALPASTVALPGIEAVLSLSTRIMALHEIAPGASVSYGGLWRAARPSRIATLPIGYADGYPQHVKGAQVLVGGRRVPVVGAVSMDMLMVDVTDVPAAVLGDPVVLIGRQGDEAIALDDVAAWAGAISWEILCGISKRVPRVYVGVAASERSGGVPGDAP